LWKQTIQSNATPPKRSTSAVIACYLLQTAPHKEHGISARLRCRPQFKKVDAATTPSKCDVFDALDGKYSRTSPETRPLMSTTHSASVAYPTATSAQQLKKSPAFTAGTSLLCPGNHFFPDSISHAIFAPPHTER